MKDIIKNLKKSDRYKDFIYFDEPVIFDKYFNNYSFDIVQVHDMTPILDGIVGFAGQFNWSNGKLIPLDGDTYETDMKVWGYKKFIGQDKEICLDILVTDW